MIVEIIGLDWREVQEAFVDGNPVSLLLDPYGLLAGLHLCVCKKKKGYTIKLKTRPKRTHADMTKRPTTS